MSSKRRIPAGDSAAFAAWAPPDVGTAHVHRAESMRARQRPADAAAAAAVSAVERPSFQDQIIENIRAGNYVAGVSARQLEEIVSEAAREGQAEGYARGHASGTEKGYRDGYARGHAEGLAEGRERIEDAARRLGGILQSLHAPLAAQEAALEQVILDAVVRIARGVVRAELKLQPESIRAVVAEAVAALPLGPAKVRVRVAESDIALLEEYAAGHGWSLEADPEVAPGGCRIVAGESLVDYPQSERFAALVEQWLGRAPRVDEALGS